LPGVFPWIPAVGVMMNLNFAEFFTKYYILKRNCEVV
jgi:hypothetical protein